MSSRQQSGFVTAEWVIGIAVLIVPVMLLMGVLPAWAARHEAAAAAAREVTRIIALAPEDPGVITAAEGSAAMILDDRGVDPGDMRMRVDVSQDGADDRDGVVRASVQISGISVSLPLLGQVDGPTLEATHSRRLNPYRSRP
ncbi:MAG: hypothetical protein ACR2HR_04295 [Euzebya sp.]